ncbi:MAG: EAL domain-containing protein [Proteobacteria bacterium]|nr:EAL domain-containing protein [Pseudomonadota bacterium]
MGSDIASIVRQHRGSCSRRCWLALACLLALLAMPAALADVRAFVFHRVVAESGLRQNDVSVLLQDRQGFIWLGTQGGLHRYDGQDYRVFVRNPADPASLPDNFITALAEGEPGSLWVGTNDAYVAQLDLASGRFRRLLPKEAAHATDGSRQVLALRYDPGHGLWVMTGAGLDLLDPQTGLRRSILRKPEAVGTRDNFQMTSDRAGILWAAMPSGLYRIDPVTLAVRSIAAPDGVSGIVCDRAGRLWVTADTLYRLDPESASLTPVGAFNKGGHAGPLQRIVADLQGRLWIAARHNALLRYDPASGATDVIHGGAAQDGALPEDEIDALLVDRTGLLWVGTFTNGVVTTDSDGARFTYISDNDAAHTQYYANSVRSFFQDTPGVLWVGTDGDGVKRYDIATDRFTEYVDALRSALPNPALVNQITVYAMASAPAGNVWVATNVGLFRLDPGHARAQLQDLGVEDTQSGVTHAAEVRALAAAPHGGLWVGTFNHGLIELDASGHRVRQILAGSEALTSVQVNRLYVDAKGALWVGTLGGLNRLGSDGNITQFPYVSNDDGTLAGKRVRSIAGGRDGSVWVGTHSGLNRLTTAADGKVSIRRYPVLDRSGRVDTVYGVVVDDRGKVWVSSNDGVLRVDPDTGATRRFTRIDGLQNLEFNGGAYLRLSDGRIAFGGIRGINTFDPDRIANDTYFPPVVLTSARIGAATGDGAGLLTATRVRMQESEALLRLRFAALEFANPQGIEYRYRLEGLDPAWVNAGHHPEATYTNLAPGHYRFRAQATNRDGLWSRRELSLPIDIIPPWWKSAPARAGYVLLALMGFALAWYLVQRRHHREIAHGRAIAHREQQLKMALWGSGDDFWDLDLAASTLRRSTAASDGRDAHIEPITVEQWRSEVLHPDDVHAVEEQLDAHLRGDTDHFESMHRVRHPRSGEWRTILARGKVVERDADGKPLRVAGTARDVSRKQREERERAIAGEVLGSMSEAVGVFGLDFRFVSVNRAFTLMTGYEEGEILGQSASTLDSTQHSPEFYRDMRHTLELVGRWSGEMWQRRKDGEEFLCSFEAVEVLESNNTRGHYVVVLNDITDRKRAEQELRYLANFDTLTGLPNRALLSERLARAIVRARRQDSMVAVLFLDLDRFKEINDSLGHAAGDRILKAVAAHLQATTNPTDTVSRLGGDEFTVVVEDIASEEDACRVARAILGAFVQPLLVDERNEVIITPSIGIALYPAHGLTPTDLLKHADSAMYQAKGIGRNTYLVYTDAMESQARQRANITAALRRAVDRNEFQLLYQPRLSLARGRISGVEALLRWHSAELGEMMPADFIPIAEETGLIVQLGEWALREACRTLAAWQADGLTDVRIAVNVSVLQLLRGDLPQLIASVLAESGAPPSRLELELTETMVMNNAAEARSIFDQLRAIGVSLAIDDFGTGYSSLVYLKQLPIDMLKIDKAFVNDITRDPDDEAITTTIITMAHSLGLTVIAEGVESQGQLDFLREHGCDEIQGYWLSQPLAEPHCRTFIHTWHHTASKLPSADPVASAPG